MVAFHADSEGEWVAELSCGHERHVRHRPPFEPRSWVLEAAGRAGRIGTPLACHLCGDAGDAGDVGGDPACWAGLLCPSCGAVLDGTGHREGCPQAE